MASTHGRFRLLLLLSLSVTAVTGDCLEGFFLHDDSCYAVPRQTASWPEAKVYCQAVGADLAVVETNEEQVFLSSYLHSHKDDFPADGFWLDGSDFLKEGAWLWARTRQRIQTTFWDSGEPNNDFHGEENCLLIGSSHHFLWNDRNCDVQNNFICEMPFRDVFITG